jgi:hypothetical protein
MGPEGYACKCFDGVNCAAGVGNYFRLSRKAGELATGSSRLTDRLLLSVGLIVLDNLFYFLCALGGDDFFADLVGL